MFYGKETTTEITDHDGSTIVTEVNWRKGKPNLPKRVTVNTQKMVKNQTQEQEEYARFSDEIAKDMKKLDPSFTIKRTTKGDAEGFYYVIASYTVLRYQ